MSTINVAMTKWLETGEICSAMMCDEKDIRTFARANGMMLQGDPILDPESEQHEVPVEIVQLSLMYGDYDFTTTFNALMDLSDSMAPGEGINQMLEHLICEAFKAGAKYQADKEVQPTVVQ